MRSSCLEDCADPVWRVEGLEKASLEIESWCQKGVQRKVAEAEGCEGEKQGCRIVERLCGK